MNTPARGQQMHRRRSTCQNPTCLIKEGGGVGGSISFVAGRMIVLGLGHRLRRRRRRMRCSVLCSSYMNTMSHFRSGTGAVAPTFMELNVSRTRERCGEGEGSKGGGGGRGGGEDWEF